jgi:four helix bundle protein
MSLKYKKLVVWQRADDLFIEVHRLTHQRFPNFERFELGSQVRRAAYSVPANVVEGSARPTGRDKIKFFNIASASLSEVTYGIHAAFRLGNIDQTTYERSEERTRMVAAPLHGLIRKERLGLRGKVIASTATMVLLFAALLT